MSLCDKCIHNKVCLHTENITTCADMMPKREWIPVSERLPEKDDLYLVYFDVGEYDLDYFYKDAFGYSRIIAWMPLPEPYKAESEE